SRGGRCGTGPAYGTHSRRRVCPRPAALAFGQAQAITETTSVAPGNIQEPRGPVTYYLTVKNPGIQVWDPDLRKYHTGGAPAYGVVAQAFVPARTSSGTVTCSGGALLNGGIAHITINTNAPPLMANYVFGAVVDPNNTISERNEGNN